MSSFKKPRVFVEGGVMRVCGAPVSGPAPRLAGKKFFGV